MEQMQSISLLLKCFIRRRKLFWLYSITVIVALILMSLLFLPETATESSGIYQVMYSLYLQPIIHILFLTLSVIAFEFSREVFEEKKEFLYQARNFGQLKVLTAALAVLLLLWAVIMTLILTILFSSAVLSNLFPAEIANVLFNAVLRIGGTLLVAILVGFFLGRVARKAAAYSLIVMMTLLLTPFASLMTSDLLRFEASHTVQLIIHWVLFAPFELAVITSIAAVDSIYLMPNEPHQWLLPTIWTTALLAGTAVSLHGSKRSSIVAFMLVFGLLITPWAVVGSQIALPRYSAAPHSIDEVSLMPEVFSSNWWQNPPDWDYHYHIPTVAHYEVDLDIRSRLSGRVVMTLDEPFLRTPTFTLFRGYHLSSITDAHGRQLDFSREGNHITILTPDQEHTTDFIFEYAGSGYGHYANSQGIFLPGSFPWYPWPGKQRFYWHETRFDAQPPAHFYRIGDVGGFDIRVASRHSEVFTPHGIILTQSDEFVFILAEDMTLMAGSVQRVGDEDTLAFYGGTRSLRFFEEPDFDDTPDVTDRNVRQQVRERAYELREAMGIESPRELRATTFVMVPEFPKFSNLYKTPLYLDDHILISEHPWIDLSLTLAMQDIVRTCEKRDVYETLFFHLIQDEWVFSYMPLANEMTELIRAEGEERAVQLVVEYLMDDTGTMSGREFFQSLLEEH